MDFPLYHPMDPRSMDPRAMDPRIMDPRAMDPRAMEPHPVDPLLGTELDLAKYTTPIRRQRLTLKQKVQVINFIAKGGRQSDACKRFGLSSSSISTLWKVKDTVLQRFRCRENADSKSDKKPQFLQIEDPLVEWVKAMKAYGIKVQGEHIKQRALELAEKMNIPSFSASSGWLQRFKKRNQKRLKLDEEGGNDDDDPFDDFDWPDPPFEIPAVENNASGKEKAKPDGRRKKTSKPKDPPRPDFTSPPIREFGNASTSSLYALERSLIDLQMEHLTKMNALLRFHRFFFYVEDRGDESADYSPDGVFESGPGANDFFEGGEDGDLNAYMKSETTWEDSNIESPTGLPPLPLPAPAGPSREGGCSPGRKRKRKSNSRDGSPVWGKSNKSATSTPTSSSATAPSMSTAETVFPVAERVEEASAAAAFPVDPPLTRDSEEAGTFEGGGGDGDVDRNTVNGRPDKEMNSSSRFVHVGMNSHESALRPQPPPDQDRDFDDDDSNYADKSFVT